MAVEQPGEQLTIPGMPAPRAKPKKAKIGGRIAQLESRLLKLELEVSLLRILLEKGNRNHA